ncbi:MAG: hypothetical protein H7Z76_11410 [Methylotenera sp.]|nr:hypothetical protein [Flavobacterium sp.]
MSELKIKLENCYGIKKLEHNFDFSQKRVFSIYAPNGTMKTSFAKTFRDFCKGEITTDIIFIDRPTIREIKDQSSTNLIPEQVCVIEPYIESYKSERLTTLLVNQELKEKYEEILKTIEQEKNNLFNKLKQLAGLTGRGNTIDIELPKIFGNKPVLDILLDLEKQVTETEEHPYSSFTYNKIFDEKVIAFLNTKDFKKQIQGYIERYDTLIQSSKYLKKGFNHYNVADVQKSLKTNGFFKAQHSVNLFNGSTNDTISNEGELQAIISKEMDAVLNDSEIQKKFTEIDGKLTTAHLREFRDYLFDNKEILPLLSNLDKFKKDIWLSYLIEQKDLFTNLLTGYKNGKIEIEKIIAIAKKEETDWKEVIKTFNKRFSVPFKLEMKNQDDVILKSESPNLNFVFQDNDLNQEKDVDEAELLKVLSQGEKRALYILNIIFEVRARQKANQETIFIVDDIADSFDYKNKYAIIEYLKEISEYTNFFLLILTHNFDFHRTVSSRLNMGRNNKLNTVKTATNVQLITEKYQKNPFTHWKDNLHQNQAMLVASIPFVRNLAEYAGHTNHFDSLTSLLHFKENTATLKLAELEAIFKLILVDKATLSINNGQNNVLDLVYDIADTILNSTDQIIDLENKIVLAIAIRLRAEQFMVLKINDDIFWKAITANQTHDLIKKYVATFPNETVNIAFLEQVNLMTPENIHLNSFMYEPILDMANEHLKQLYRDTRDNLN